MGAAVSLDRTQAIKVCFKDHLFEFAEYLSVRVDMGRAPSMVSMPFGRGSEGSRGIIAFYYTFLHTVRRYSSCGSRAGTAVPYFLDFAKSANISALGSLAHRLPRLRS